MKTKLLALLLLVMISLLSASAQYKSVFGSKSTSWNQLFDDNSTIFTDSLFVTGDTIVNSILYKTIGLLSRNDFENGYYLLRETPDRSKVYMYFPEKVFPNMIKREFLVMDLNLNVHDSFLIEEANSSQTIFVDSVFIDSENRKHVRFAKRVTNFLGDENFEFIEGIGTNLGLFYKGVMFDYWAPSHNYLLCSHQNDTVSYFGKQSKNQCSFFLTDIKETRKTQSILLSFDKRTNQLVIKSNNVSEADFTFALYSANGTMLKQADETTLPTSIGLSNLPNGVYIVSLKTTNRVFNRKIVVNR
ncbi:MAG: T9SS type A sorting domain-containing protein [Bacteroidales bacterium]